jgi:hypothetical protein
MKNIKKIFCILFLLCTETSWATEPWVSEDFPFDTLKLSTTEQAQKWATCAATYEVISDILRMQGKPAMAENIHEYFNGAGTVIMSIFLMDFSSQKINFKDPKFSEKFKKIREYAIHASKDYPKSRKNKIMALLEAAENKEEWSSAAKISFERCSKKEALELQQVHIDAMRALLIGISGK